MIGIITTIIGIRKPLLSYNLKQFFIQDNVGDTRFHRSLTRQGLRRSREFLCGPSRQRASRWREVGLLADVWEMDLGKPWGNWQIVGSSMISIFPYAPCMAYLPTWLGDFVQANVGKYSSTMEYMGLSDWWWLELT
jgi:hypothetical protein